MKNLHQIEKHLADKLQNVPVPDVDQGWEQMRKLLDNEMPEPVAGAWSGNRKWWWMGITAGIIMLATWLTQQLNNEALLSEQQVAKREGVVYNNGANEKNEASTETKNNTGIENNDAVNNNVTQKTNETNNKDAGAVTTTNNANTNGKSLNDVGLKQSNIPPVAAGNSSSTDIAENSADKPSLKPGADKITTRNSDHTAATNALSSKQHQSDQLTGNVTKTTPVVEKNDVAKRRDVASKQSAADQHQSTQPVSNTTKQRSNNLTNQITNNTARQLAANTSDQPATNATGDNAISKSNNSDDIEPSVVNIAITAESNIAGPADQFTAINNLQPGQIAVSGKTDRAFAREMRKKSMKADNRRMSRSSMRGRSGDNEKELTFAAGLALPQSFAVGGQHSSSYNVNGGSGRITDYLPAPFFQYHVNDKLFVQTEFHFQSPQYTQRFLLSRSIDSFASRVYENNVRLEKLYYFNIPFNVYFSPARNFYIGGGVQYSSLLSGVASYENRTTEGQTVLNHASVARRFSYDSVASVFSPSEWRYQFDANYYFNRFTLGLRFNQAMTNFIDIRSSGYVPAARDRNRSFLLYLRFNIWEERKKE